jgi:hypothetical protein
MANLLGGHTLLAMQERSRQAVDELTKARRLGLADYAESMREELKPIQRILALAENPEKVDELEAQELMDMQKYLMGDAGLLTSELARSLTCVRQELLSRVQDTMVRRMEANADAQDNPQD